MSTKPLKISQFRDRLAEIGRASTRFRSALAQSNNEQHQQVFQPLLNIAERMIAAERDGVTENLLDDLHALRTSIRRMPLPDIDPELDYETPSLLTLRVARSNFVESLDNAIDAASGLLRRSKVDSANAILVDRADVAQAMRRLDARLAAIERELADLKHQSVPEAIGEVETRGDIVNRFVQKLGIEIELARFETYIAQVVDF
jgi:hypothetical protein